MPNESLIDALTAQLVPVRPRRAAREYTLLGAVGALELALFLSVGVMRPDMGQAIGHPFMWWKLGSLGCLAALSVATAVRSFSPTVSPRRGLMIASALGALWIIAAGVIDSGSAVASTFTERISPVHGLLCASCIVVLSLPLLAALSILMRRAAPTHVEKSALAIGLAAGAWGAFVFAFCCPVNDPLYVAVWYSAACAVVMWVARLMLPRVFRL
jgi:hypothetical protein